jgi:isopenicillin N synthase-like dioxygenase
MFAYTLYPQLRHAKFRQTLHEHTIVDCGQGRDSVPKERGAHAQLWDCIQLDDIASCTACCVPSYIILEPTSCTYPAPPILPSTYPLSLMSTSTTQTIYAPPPGPPPNLRPQAPQAPHDPRPPLLPTSSPIDLTLLASQGWISLPLEQYPSIRDAYSDLFNLSEQLFDLPDEHAEKTTYAAPSGTQASEEGYSRIVGEKQILTCRSEPRSPELVRDGVRQAWKATGELMNKTMSDIAVSLGLAADAYSEFVEPCTTFHEEKTPTLLRMFRYERPAEGQPLKVVAEPHRDLGMLSLVIGHTPGLDVWEPPSAFYPDGRWVGIEDPVDSSDGTSPSGRRLTATLLSGQVLSFLSQGRYKPGPHRVSVYPSSSTPYRFSLVFALRPFPAPVYTDKLETAQTGKFQGEMRMEGESMGRLFERIVKSHWNVNVSKDIRDDQRRKFEEMRAKQGTQSQSQEQDKEEDRNEPVKPKRFSRVLRLIGKK